MTPSSTAGRPTAPAATGRSNSRSEPHAYPAAGTYRVLVKAIDIFGNDTSQVYEVKVA